MSPRFDAVIVGSGATGGWAAMELTAQGMNVLLLEAGPAEMEIGSTSSPVYRASDPAHVRQPVQSLSYAYRDQNRHLFVDDLDHPYTTSDKRPFIWIRSRQLGGRLALWEGAALRFGPSDFTEAERDGIGAPWPLSYDELAPYYDRVEDFFGVSGHRDGHPMVPDGCFRPAPPLVEGEQRFKTAVESRFPDRRVLRARGISSPSSTVAKARGTGRLTLIANAFVHRILVDTDTGLCSGVAYIDRYSHKARDVHARIVIVAASTIETTRLLFLSATRQHPEGLGNSSGLLGCFLMDHVCSGVAIGTIEGLANRADDRVAGLYVPRFRNVDRRHPDFRRGFGIDLTVQRQIPSDGLPAALRQAPGGDGPVAHFRMRSFGEVLPVRDNRVTLDPKTCDCLGLPAARIDYAYSPNEEALARDQLLSMREMAEAAGFDVLYFEDRRALPGLSSHEVGTARMGRDAKSSVLNRYNQSWDVKNLFVVDGSCFVSNPCQNPTLTMMALCARACDHLVAECRAGNL